MISWLLHNLFWVVIVVVGFNVIRVVARVRNALTTASRSLEEKSPRRIGNQDPDELERAARVRAEIMRKIAERMGGPVNSGATPRLAPTDQAPSPPALAPSPVDMARRLQETWRRTLVPPIDTFGGPATKPAARGFTPAPAYDVSRKALQSEPVLTDTPPLVLPAAGRRFPQPAPMVPIARNSAFVTATSGSNGPRENLMSDLGSPARLRQAFILREVLGPPVALR